MSKPLIEQLPPGVYLIFAAFALGILIFGVRTANSVPESLENAKCAPLEDLPESQRKELQRQICPDWKPKEP